ncbi:MAG TPA: SDR family NAD(P)-dependent oxidoreductase [Bacillota bacterium]|nr:SDR family NAD(P)-dependent oxidoreductase [Bacillota bacterium]
MEMIPLIATGNLRRDTLAGQVAVVTGAGRGIGFEAARALAWLGARVVVAEIDRKTGRQAAARISAEMGAGTAVFIHTDVGSEHSVTRLARRVARTLGQVDIVLNNATAVALGAISDRPVADWDLSYRVNLRGPALLARTFLPGMLARDRGVFVSVASSPGPYLGAYEVLKTAQVELANILAAELEGTGVKAFAIGPGIARTATFEAAITQLAPLYGQTVEQFLEMNKNHLISVEAAGAGFAAAIALAGKFHGQLLSARPALFAADIDLPGEESAAENVPLSEEEYARALAACQKVRRTLQEQVEGWRARPLFERQWMLRDFRKEAGLPVEDWLEGLAGLEIALSKREAAAPAQLRLPLERLSSYYGHLAKMAADYFKDPAQRDEYIAVIHGWQQEVAELVEALGRKTGA